MTIYITRSFSANKFYDIPSTKV